MTTTTRMALPTLAIALSLSACGAPVEGESQRAGSRPNIVLLMSDDQGWGDIGYNGNRILKTPHLDAMAAEGVQLNRFYAASPVCSPTRASVLTGRHPFRYGIEWAGQGHLPLEELTLAEVLRDAGYYTGHFGKWHVGELSLTVNQSYFPGNTADPAHYAPPWEQGFGVSFSTESMMPTYNPYYHVGGEFGSEDYRLLQTEPVAEGQRDGGFRWRDFFWKGPGELEDRWLAGDSSRIIMDHALEFIEGTVAKEAPFLAVVWFHTPHTPLVAGDDDRAPYDDQPMEAQHWYGAISAMDREIGRLRLRLQELGVADDTLVWFSSDNGPSYVHEFNSAGPFKGKKAELSEGGIRVPGIVAWPDGLEGGRALEAPMSTSDIFPTVVAATDSQLPEDLPVLDGIDALPLLRGEREQRGSSIAFQSPVRGSGSGANAGSLQFALSGDRYKLFSDDNGTTWQLYDLVADPGESNDVAGDNLDKLDAMKKQLDVWVEEVRLDSEDRE